jgi:phosphoglucosamine mutase
MERIFFGTDGIRGAVGTPPITPDFVLKLAHAVGRVLKKTESKPVVLIGKDTRISGYMLESAMESGFNSAGVDVTLLGPLPTPGVAYLTHALRASLGVVLSASHNPFSDNGIKFFNKDGRKFSDAWEFEIESVLAQDPVWVSSDGLGKSKRLDDAAGRYIEFCKSTFPSNLSLNRLKIVIDAANGAAYKIAPAVFHELGADVSCIGCSPDGFNINLDVGATNPDALIKAVIEQKADFGIALDGDADRVLMIDSDGRLFNGDELLYLIVLLRLFTQEKIGGVVGTLMTNMAIEQAIFDKGIPFIRSKVGDRYILEELEARGWLLGGESSGHLLMLDKHTTGDGIIAALQIIQLCIREQKSIGQLLKPCELFSQTLINVRMRPGFDWQNNPQLIQAKQSAEHLLGSNGRVLIRASGTEPVLRIMVEAMDSELTKQIAQKMVEIVAID